jgi:hypothetical protein
LAEGERRIARQLRQDPAAGQDELRQLAGEQERAAERAERLAERARALRGGDQAGSGAGQREPEAAVRSLADAQLESQLREAARTLRQIAGPGATGERAGAQHREADRADGLARLLEGAARELGRTAGTPDRSAQLSEQLARAGELGDRLSELTRRLNEDGSRGTGERGDQAASERAGGQPSPAQGGRPQGPDQTGQRASGQNQSQGGEPGGAGAAADRALGPGEVQEELRALGRLAEGLGEEGEELRDALQALLGSAPTRSAPGTEAWKQDFSRWESLRLKIAEALAQFEARVSASLQEQERQDRLEAGASDEAPDAYRREVERY